MAEAMHPIISTERWREYAACRDIGPDLFYPIGKSLEALEQTEQAKKICRTCEVAQHCLDYALETNQDYGVWGGMDEYERHAFRRRWRAAFKMSGL